MNSSVLLIGSQLEPFQSWGADTYNIQQALQTEALSHHLIFIELEGLTLQQIKELFKKISDPNFTQVAGLTKKIESLPLEHLQFHYRKVLEQPGDAELESVAKSLLEKSLQIQQSRELIVLIQQQRQDLLRLSQDLEEKVHQRQIKLEKSHNTLVETNRKAEILQKSLVAIYRAKSIGEMERLLHEALAPYLHIHWTRLQITGKPTYQTDSHGLNVFELPLYREDIVYGSLVIAKKKPNTFSKQEKTLLQQIGEAVSLATSLMQALHQLEEISSQWNTTFNAISIPISTVDAQYNIIESNLTFSKNAKKPHEVKCYKNLFDRDAPCEGCELGSKFRIFNSFSKRSEGSDVLEVTSQQLETRNHFVNFYQDISQQLKLETEITENAKMQDVGIIGSSIAHELNNPLAGVLTYLQLLKNDIPKDSPYYEDIAEMETSALKCKDIIQNLLSFSRVDSEVSRLDINAALKRIMQILELQYRSSDISIQLHLHKEPIVIPLIPSLFSQSILSFLQQIVLNLPTEKLATSPKVKPLQSIKLSTRPNTSLSNANSSTTTFGGVIEIEYFELNRKNTETQIFRRSIAEQILTQLGARVEYFSTNSSLRTVKISFDRPVFD